MSGRRHLGKKARAVVKRDKAPAHDCATCPPGTCRLVRSVDPDRAYGIRVVVGEGNGE